MEKSFKNKYQQILSKFSLIKGKVHDKVIMFKPAAQLALKYQTDEVFARRVKLVTTSIASVATITFIGNELFNTVEPAYADDIPNLESNSSQSPYLTDVPVSVPEPPIGEAPTYSTSIFDASPEIVESTENSVEPVGETLSYNDDLSQELNSSELTDYQTSTPPTMADVSTFNVETPVSSTVQQVDGVPIDSDTPVIVENLSNDNVSGVDIVNDSNDLNVSNDVNTEQTTVVDDSYNHASLQLYTSPDNGRVAIITPDDALSYDQLHEVFNNLQKDGYIPSDARFEDVEFRLSYDDTLDNWNLVELGDNNEYTYEKLDPDKTEVYKPYEPEPEPEPTPEPDPEPTPEPTPEPDPEPQPEPEPEPQPEPKPTPEPEQPHVIPEQPAGMLPPLGDNVSNYGIAALASAITGAALYANHKRQQIEFAGITSTISNSLDELRDLKDSLLAVISDYKEEVKSYTKIK